MAVLFLEAFTQLTIRMTNAGVKIFYGVLSYCFQDVIATEAVLYPQNLGIANT